MLRAADLLMALVTFGLPVSFALMDRRAFPRLRWVQESAPPPAWARAVVWVGLAIVILAASLAPISGFHPGH